MTCRQHSNTDAPRLLPGALPFIIDSHLRRLLRTHPSVRPDQGAPFPPASIFPQCALSNLKSPAERTRKLHPSQARKVRPQPCLQRTAKTARTASILQPKARPLVGTSSTMMLPTVCFSCPVRAPPSLKADLLLLVGAVMSLVTEEAATRPPPTDRHVIRVQPLKRQEMQVRPQVVPPPISLYERCDARSRPTLKTWAQAK